MYASLCHFFFRPISRHSPETYSNPQPCLLFVLCILPFLYTQLSLFFINMHFFVPLILGLLLVIHLLIVPVPLLHACKEVVVNYLSANLASCLVVLIASLSNSITTLFNAVATWHFFLLYIPCGLIYCGRHLTLLSSSLLLL